jgi:16S rRNA (uracil1498-N3)-methyltransferase
MPDRYFVDVPITEDAVTLDGTEAHHLRNVMRATAGTRVLLFDGSGAEFVGEIVHAKRSGVELRIVERLEIDRELPFRLTVGVALPKGERQRWLVEKGVELGVTEFVPLTTERGVAEATPNALGRLRRAVIEATKQCGRNRLLVIGEPVSLSEYCQRAPGNARRLIAHPDGPGVAAKAQATGSPAPGLATAPCADVYLAIGPEGGFTTAEVAAAESAGWSKVGLGPRILRVETAALLLAGLAAQGRL